MGGDMRHDSNWLEYLRKLANESADSSRRNHQADSRRGMGTLHAPHHRDEWLRAGYSAQMSLPFRGSRWIRHHFLPRPLYRADHL